MTAFPGHIVVAADVDRPWLDARLPDEDLAAPLSPRFLTALEDRLGLVCGCIDAVVFAAALTGPPPVDLTPIDDSSHPRVARARLFRSDVRVWTHGAAVLVIGRGLAGRWEAAIEVDARARNTGLGRSLALAARHLVPGHSPVWAQIAPGNASSLRAFLAAGYQPVGGEVLLTPHGA
ncbi:GNAT family N-acetyltransferase [Actinoplanes sp. NPDC049316]|uniref:GNAT family N-acetyltransferase n=1 Tax=Actinoplanes sp. NPDC049316 TaxID=3154727 RepID=UPI0034471E5C